MSLENEIKNLSSRINNYKRFYWFNLVPVLGWIGCSILYFSKIKSMENELNRLRLRYDSTKANVFHMENLGCKSIEDLIDSVDDYNKDKQNSTLEIVEQKEESSQPLLGEQKGVSVK